MLKLRWRQKTRACRFEPKKLKKKRAPKVDQFLPRELVATSSSLELRLPIKTVSEANRFEHWKARASRQKAYSAEIVANLAPNINLIKKPCIITLKRYGPKLLDEHDNLRMAFKKIVDIIAQELTGKKRGQGDNDPRLTWRYDQEKSAAYGVRITFEF